MLNAVFMRRIAELNEDRHKRGKPTSSCMVDSIVGCLDDAVKGQISMKGQALLQWGFTSNGFASHSVQMPEVVVDQVLRWRDQSLAPNSIVVPVNNNTNVIDQ